MTPDGFDYADMDAAHQPDFAAAHRAGAKFVIIRRAHCYWGESRETYALARDRCAQRKDAAAARAAGLVVGEYMMPAWGAKAPSAAAQVANFRDAGAAIQSGLDLPPIIDVEFPGRGIADTGRSQADALAFLHEIVLEMKATFNVDPMIYTSHVQWHDTNGLGGPNPDWAGRCPLWQKTPYRLRAGNAPDPVAPTRPHIGSDVRDPHDYWRTPAPWTRAGAAIQQYQGDARGYAGTFQADLNVFLGAQRGDRGPRVAWLQDALGIVSDGAFGAQTEAALHHYQAARGLPESGVLDIVSFAALAWE